MPRCSAPLALYPDPLAAPEPTADVEQLAALIAGAPDDVSPLVVLDGPSIVERLACLAELVAREVHPRLHVLVPCDHATARRLLLGERGRARIDERQRSDRLSSVQYLKFDTRGRVPRAIGCDLPALTIEAELARETRDALAADLGGDA